MQLGTKTLSCVIEELNWFVDKKENNWCFCYRCPSLLLLGICFPLSSNRNVVEIHLLNSGLTFTTKRKSYSFFLCKFILYQILFCRFYTRLSIIAMLLVKCTNKTIWLLTKSFANVDSCQNAHHIFPTHSFLK